MTDPAIAGLRTVLWSAGVAYQRAVVGIQRNKTLQAIARPFAYVLGGYNSLLKRHPVLTNMATSGVVMYVGDYAAQQAQHESKWRAYRRQELRQAEIKEGSFSPSNPNRLFFADKEKAGEMSFEAPERYECPGEFKLSVKRSAILTSWNAIGFAPIWSFWFRLADYLMPQKGVKEALKKVCITTVCAAPPANALFIAYVEAATQYWDNNFQSFDTVKWYIATEERIKNYLYHIWQASFFYWGVCNLFNWLVLPYQYRTVFSTVASTGWSYWLSSSFYNAQGRIAAVDFMREYSNKYKQLRAQGWSEDHVKLGGFPQTKQERLDQIMSADEEKKWEAVDASLPDGWSYLGVGQGIQPLTNSWRKGHGYHPSEISHKDLWKEEKRRVQGLPTDISWEAIYGERGPRWHDPTGNLGTH
ncbi:unnamed protein product [Vitrella brassicaformis CCMP3155]|uniref:Uncharacterized protein n=1 Tax=Vitrella brassicaformis (strain CCMP3155) TaxID=1169540 RepID=A0A0G4EBP9_VITBC|nr:unnamed protein product [Vitrella brassicaformis CCMP3155]|eukprot:CEL92955.1 unnamed protein product [Vitrella brassicaformis CCMP3155]